MKRMKGLVLAVLLAVSITVLSACGSTALTKPTPSEGQQTVEVTGECQISRSGDTITVSGTTNLLDGSIVQVSLDSFNGDVLAAQKYTVSGESISVDFPVDAKWTGAVYGHITCTPKKYGDQPQNVYEQYGSRFENMTGADVLWNVDGNAAVFQSEKIDL